MTQIIKTPTSSAKKRRKQKPNKAQRELMQAHAELLAKWASVPKWAFSAPKRRHAPATPAAPPKPASGPPRPASRVTPGGSTALKPAPVYTGTKVIGIATEHKSRLTPVFSEEAAKDIAKMRRG